MQPGALILAFISCWLIAVLGGYLAVVGLGNLRRHHLAGQLPVAWRSQFPLQRQLFMFWDVLLSLLGSLLMVSGMVFLYLLVYG